MKLRVFLLLLMAGLGACHRDPGKAPVAPIKPRAGVKTAAPHGPNSQELTAGMVEAVTQGRSQAPVSLKFDLLERPVPGQPLDVAIALVPQIPAPLATVEVSGSDGLKLEDDALKFQFATLEAAQVYRHRLKVTPTGEGLYLLTLAVSLQHDQIADSRVFTVPILVGPGTAVGSSPQLGAAPADAAAGAAAPQKDSSTHRGS